MWHSVYKNSPTQLSQTFEAIETTVTEKIVMSAKAVFTIMFISIVPLKMVHVYNVIAKPLYVRIKL